MARESARPSGVPVCTACGLCIAVWHRISRRLLAPALAVALAAPAAAQSTPARIDSGHSYATLWMGRQTEATQMVNVGVAQVGGSITLGTPDPSASALKFSLVPGGEGAQLLAPDGTIRTGEIARIARYTVMTFQTEHTRVRRDGRLEIAGILAVTHVTREVISQPWNWNYSGVSFADPVSKTAERPVTFVVVSPRADVLAAHPDAAADILATATTPAGDFPELGDDVLDATWPIVAQDEHCPPPVFQGARRDYSGVICDGKAITTNNPVSENHSFGLDYSGMRGAAIPVHGPVTIVLHLKLAPPAPAPPGR